MKRLLASMTIALGISALGENPAIVAEQPWAAQDEANTQVYSIVYPGTNYPALAFTVDTAPDAFYKIEFMMKAQEAGPDQVVLAFDGPLGKGNTQYPLAKEWSVYSTYLFSGNGGAFNFRLYLNPGPVRNIQVKSISATKLSPEDLKANLLPNGDFERQDGITSSWTKSWGVVDYPASIVPSEGFLSGERSMAIDFKPQADGSPVGIQSIQMPVALGKEYEIKFWAKAEQEFPINVDTQTWSVYGHKEKHFWKRDVFKITPEWKEYSLRVAISSDLAQYPDLSAKTVFFYIGAVAKDQKCRVLFDDVNFKQVGN